MSVQDACVFLVQHEHKDDVKVIGIFTSREKADAAVEELKTKPGFNLGEFSVDEYPLDKVHWREGFV